MAADDEEVFGSLYEGDDDSDSALPASSKFDVEDISSEEEEEDDNDDDEEEEEDDDLQIVLNDDENHHEHSNGSFPEQMFLHAHSNDLTSSKASYDVLTGPSKVNSNVFTRRSNGFTEFIVPQNKTIFDVNIDSLEDKKWRQPGADVSDFFNFGFNEESWKLYSNQMRFQIVGSHPTAATATFGQSAKQYKLEIKSFFERSEIPTGKPIQVEFSDIERLPSSNTRRPRPCDSDVIIEIPLHDDKENSCGTNELESSENCEGNWRETSKSSNYNTGKHELDHAIKSYSGKESHGHSDNQENRFFTPPSRLASDDRELSSDTICNIRTSTVVNNREHKLPNDQHSNGQIPCYDDECSPSPCKPKSGRSLMLHGKLKACDTMNTKTMHCGVQDREGEIVSGLEGKTCRSHYSVNESAADCSFSVNILKNDNSEFISRTSRDPLENFDDNMNEVVRCKSEKMFCCVTSMVPEKAEACSRENSYKDSKDLFVTKSDAPSESSHDVVNLLVTDLTSLEKNQNSRQCRKNDAGRNSKNRVNCVNIKSVIVAADRGRHKHEKTIYSKQRIRQKDGWDTQSEHVPCKTKLVDGQIVQRIDRKKRNKIERSSRRENIECWDRHTKLYEKSPRNERANSQRRKEIGLLKRLEDSMAFNDQSVREEPISLQPLKPWFVADNSEGTTEKSMLMTRHENKKNGTSSLYSRRRLKNDSDSSHHYKKNAVYFHSSSSCLENDNNQMLYFDDTMDRTSSKEKHSRDPVCLRSHLINGTCISSFNSRRIETQREPVGLSTLYLNEKICTYATQEQGKQFRVQANCEILSHQIPNISDRPDEDLETNKVLATEATDFTQACEKIQKHSLLLAETNGFNNCITDLNVEEDVNQRETLMSSAERGSEICQGDQKSEGNDTRCRNSSLNIVHSHKKMEDSNQTVLSPQLLEALAKIEKRRERFKQPLVTENHVGRNNIQNKTNEQEISEVTQQRRSRKRKWGST